MLRVAPFVVALLASAGSALAGSVFLTGHDPDFHATQGGNLVGARTINNRAIDFIMDPAFNTYRAGGINRFLFVESNISPPGGHVRGVNGIVASGYANGVDFDHVDASTLNAALNQLGVTYSGIVIASDFGGLLTQAELNILNARSSDIISFLNGGGGLYAMAESNNGAGLTPQGGHYGYLPFVVTSTGFNQTETGITVTPFGASLGLDNSHVNGNASHNIFTGTGGLTPVDIDRFGNTLTIAGRGAIGPGGIAPLPSAAGLGLAGMGMLGARRRRRAM